MKDWTSYYAYKEVEVISATLDAQNKEVEFECIDLDKIYLDYLARAREDEDPKIITITYNCNNKYQFNELRRLIKSLKEEVTTWGTAVQTPVGYRFTLNKYGKFSF